MNNGISFRYQLSFLEKLLSEIYVPIYTLYREGERNYTAGRGLNITLAINSRDSVVGYV